MGLFQPTYAQIIEKINEENGEETLESRYSVVIAAAKRARQLVDGDDALVPITSEEEKALTIAVDEIYSGEVKISRRKAEESVE